MSVILGIRLLLLVAALVAIARLWRRLGPRLFARAVIPPVIIVVALASLMGPLERRSWMVDLTENRRNTLSSISDEVLDRVKGDVRATAFFIPGKPGWENPTAVMKAYERMSSKVKVRFVDPNRQPALARNYGVEYFGQVVVEAAGRRERSNFADEIDVTGAILRLTRSDAPRLCFVTGHGEHVPDEVGMGQLMSALERSHTQVKTVSLATTDAPLSGCTAAVVAGAKVPPLPQERNRWQAFLEADGKALVLLEAGGPGMDAWLPNGIHVGEESVADHESGLIDDPEAVVAGIFGSSNPVTRDLAPVFLLNPLAVTLDRDPQGEGGVVLSKLLVSSPTAKAGDRRGSSILAAAYDRSGVERQKGGDSRIRRSRMVVMGDADWLADGQIGLLDNRRMLGNAVEWLVQQENLIDIPARPLDPPVLLTSGDSRSVLLTSVVIPPALLLAIGAAVTWMRRKA